jgi:hypothetical protein
MLTIELMGIALLGAGAVAINYRCRSRFLFRDVPPSVLPFGCVALLYLAALPPILFLLGPHAPHLLLDVAPIIVLTSYSILAFMLVRLPRRWRESSALVFAALAPLLGCVLIALILLHDGREFD